MSYRGEIKRELAHARVRLAVASGDELQNIKAKSTLGRNLVADEGNTEAGLGIFQEVMVRYQNLYSGTDMFIHSHVAEAGLDLVATLNVLGRYHEAIGWLEKLDNVLQSGRAQWRQWEGNMLRHFACAYGNLGRREEALPYAERSVQLHQRYLDRTGDYQPTLACAMETKASLIFNLGQREEGLRLVREAYIIMKKAMGSNHPSAKGLKEQVRHMEEVAGLRRGRN